MSNFKQLILLLWNHFVQLRRDFTSLFIILFPLLILFFMHTIIHGKVSKESKFGYHHNTFCALPETIDLTRRLCMAGYESHDPNLRMMTPEFLSYTAIAYSPQSEGLKKVMSFFNLLFGEVVELKDSAALHKYFVFDNNSILTMAGIEFDDSYKDITDINGIKNLKCSIRFPGRLRHPSDEEKDEGNWYTGSTDSNDGKVGKRVGGRQSYFMEGFIVIQHYLTLFLALARNNLSHDNMKTVHAWLDANPPPHIHMRMYSQKQLVLRPSITIHLMLIMVILLCFMTVCSTTVTLITAEKEKQLKMAMMIMGLHSWINWIAWFIRTFLLSIIIAIEITVFLTIIKHKGEPSIIYCSNTALIFVFFALYVCSTCTFYFALSVFFSKARSASDFSGYIWLASAVVAWFTLSQYDNLNLAAKVSTSLIVNNALGFGLRAIFLAEDKAVGAQWNTLFTSDSSGDEFTLGWIMIMMVINTVLYFVIAMYFEAILSEAPKPWYFPVTSKFWCGESKNIGEEDLNVREQPVNKGEYFEKDPVNLKATVQIKNLQKKYKKIVAVKNVSLNIYENQITVLLGHNGAGKTTTLSMLTGMITPSGGTAIVLGYDIRRDINEVRKNVGICAQNDILFDHLSVYEHLYLYCGLKGVVNCKSEANNYLEILELKSKRKEKASLLSGGMKRKLCLGIAFCGNSKVVILDEPTAGIDASGRRLIWELIQTQKEGRTIILTTHYMNEADYLGDRIAIMAGGELKCCGTGYFLKKKYDAARRLIIDKSSNCNANEVTSFLRKYIQNIKIYSNLGSKLTYLIPESQFSVLKSTLPNLEAQKNSLGILGFSLSFTSLEEVFIKAGVDSGEHDMPNASSQNVHATESVGVQVPVETRVNNTRRFSLKNCCFLLINQFLAMLMKKIMTTARCWLKLLSNICCPAALILLQIHFAMKILNSPPLPLDLSRFGNPTVLVEEDEDNKYTDIYRNVLKDLNYKVKNVEDITTTLQNQKAEDTVREPYFVAAAFGSSLSSRTLVPLITAWFNINILHSPAISLSLALNAMFRGMSKCMDCTIEFTNHPLPFKPDDLVHILVTKSTNLAVAISLGMGLISTHFIFFTVTERSSNFKHLQFVSGVKVYVFWISSLFCDMVTYIVTVVIIAMIMKLVVSQEFDYLTTDYIGNVLLIIFLYFGVACIPALYLLGFMFKNPSAAQLIIVMISLLVGFAAITFRNDYGKKVHDVLQIIPYYSLCIGVMDSYKLYSINRICELCETRTCSILFTAVVCPEINDDYFSMEVPGIGRSLYTSLIVGAVCFILLLAIDYRLLQQVYYCLRCIRREARTGYEDSDVLEEKQKIMNASKEDIAKKYSVVLRNFTKRYVGCCRKFIPVNSLYLGLEKYECFGLLGLNGCGKSTSFKMLTGDINISFGNAWVNGSNIKYNLTSAHKVIGYCPQLDALLDNLTVREAIIMFALLRGMRLKSSFRLAEYFASELDFRAHLDKRVDQLSGGNKKKLSLSICLTGDPLVMLLDEPTNGMDDRTKRYVWKSLCRLREEGRCIILASHDMEECEVLCTRIAIMKNGKFLCMGQLPHLKRKFAGGYTVTIKLNRLQGIELTQDFMEDKFPGAILREKHVELLNYYITDKSMTWLKIYFIMEDGKQNKAANIEDYTIEQSSLEQAGLISFY